MNNIIPIVLCVDASNLRNLKPLINSIKFNVKNAKIYLITDLLIKPNWAYKVKVIDKNLLTDECISWVNYMGYARFFIHDLFPELTQCIYLDYDTIVIDDISELLNEKSGYILKVALHDTTLFNSGVLVFNFTEECLELLDECKKRISNKTHDQEILQEVFKDRVTFIDYAYNTCISGITILVKNPKIIHYCGPQKPWQISNFIKYYFDYI